MAGRGSRLRPHTLTVPKPLVPVAGKPIVQRIVEDIAKSINEEIEEVAFIIGDFGKEAEELLLGVADALGTKGTICYQDEPLGTAHAVLCAKESLKGPCIVAFADCLFRSDSKLDTSKEGAIWVKKVDNPSSFGVVHVADEGYITNFYEKPETFISDLAIIGIYYFQDGEYLRRELQYLIDNNIIHKGEYQITDALDSMRKKGVKFFTNEIDEWLDCGNKDAVVYSNQRVLENNKGTNLVSSKATIENTTIIEPCMIADGAVIKDSVIGPHVSVGFNTTVVSSVIKNSVIQNDSHIENVVLKNSMIGNKAEYKLQLNEISIGDYSKL